MTRTNASARRWPVRERNSKMLSKSRVAGTAHTSEARLALSTEQPRKLLQHGRVWHYAPLGHCGVRLRYSRTERAEVALLTQVFVFRHRQQNSNGAPVPAQHHRTPGVGDLTHDCRAVRLEIGHGPKVFAEFQSWHRYLNASSILPEVQHRKYGPNFTPSSALLPITRPTTASPSSALPPSLIFERLHQRRYSGHDMPSRTRPVASAVVCALSEIGGHQPTVKARPY